MDRMRTDLTPDDLAGDEAMRRAAIRIAPTMPATVDQVYGWLLDVARVYDAAPTIRCESVGCIEPLVFEPTARPRPSFKDGLRRPWWERKH